MKNFAKLVHAALFVAVLFVSAMCIYRVASGIHKTENELKTLQCVVYDNSFKPFQTDVVVHFRSSDYTEYTLTGTVNLMFDKDIDPDKYNYYVDVVRSGLSNNFGALSSSELDSRPSDKMNKALTSAMNYANDYAPGVFHVYQISCKYEREEEDD